MKKKSELLGNEVVSFNVVKNLEGRVFYSGKITEWMQVRCFGKDGRSIFQCGIDVDFLRDGDFIVTTTTGHLWGYSFIGVIESVVEYCGYPLDSGCFLCLCDDSQDSERNEITDKETLRKLLRRMEEIDLNA